jgi:hypothetical protein
VPNRGGRVGQKRAWRDLDALLIEWGYADQRTE